MNLTPTTSVGSYLATRLVQLGTTSDSITNSTT
jgi:hypothetical protein